MRNKKEVEKIEINISNRVLYSVVFLIAIILLGVGVYAYNTPPATYVGHTMNELTPPTGSGFVTFSSGSWVNTANLPPSCTGYRETLKYDATTRLWSCGPVGFSCTWVGWSPNIPSSRFTQPQGCYYIDTCSDINDCSTELCPYYLDGQAMVPPEEWQVYANPVLQTECVSGDVTQFRYISVCPSDATANCGYADMNP